MKKVIIATIALVGLTFASCSSEKKEPAKDGETAKTEEKKPGFADICKDDNNIFLKIKGYGSSGVDTSFVYDGKFEVKRSDWTVKNDSVAELRMYNYELGAPDADDNLQIYVQFNAKNGNKLSAATYAYQEWNDDFWSKVNIITPQGTVWFNWSMGMPEQGHVELKYNDKNNVCGKFMLEVNGKSSTIGKVSLQGTFKHQ